MKISKSLPQFAVVLMAAVLAGPISGCATKSERSTDRSSERSSERPSGVGEYVSDSVITTKIKSKLATADDVSAVHIKVDTDKNGVVVLSGTAKSKAEADKAHAIAHSVEGVTKVINNIRIKKED
ncbi:BON domain-containing protein [Nitrosospira sp. Is2]|uniref:BON domain-containing protein n=1 Tax=Nitrosospira sp. Is2 TaxID=3080532 RepID=UPI0029556C9A|nr:BON domain-containing protein [Nitrosospira sp. Is2]WON73775.1 BON domain-containing protein [Nitrosospira sp. Is2]